MSFSSVPETITAGDTVIFSIPESVNTLGDSTITTTLTFSYRDGDKYQIETASYDTANGDFGFAFSTSGWLRGLYDWDAYVTHNGQRLTVASNRVNVLPDPALPVKSSSHAERVLAAIEATLEGVATNSEMMMSISGRMITRYSTSELLKLRSVYLREVSNERKRDGHGNKDNIKIRFYNGSVL